MSKKKEKKSLFYSFWRIVIRPFFMLKYHLEFRETENVPDSGAYILASNHREAVDPIFIGEAIKRQVFFMAKDELFKNKFVGWFLGHLGAFPVERGSSSSRGAIKHFEDIVKEGRLMGIFIEGTRSKSDDFLPPKNGVSLIAYDTKTPVIPVCITIKGKKHIVHFGKPLSTEELGLINGGARELRSASRAIMDKIKVLREQDLRD